MNASQIRIERAGKHHQLLVRRHLLRNYLAHAVEGGLYMGGMQFLSAQTVLPPIVKSLGGPNWLTALMPIIMMLGFVSPPLLVAHRIERMNKHKPLVVVTGSTQRIPYVLAGIALIWFGRDHPGIALWAVALCPLLTGLIGGFGLTAWQELLAKTVPAQRRSSLFAVRNVAGAGIGILAGVVVKEVLGRSTGGDPYGYGLLHLIAFAFSLASFAAFLFIRETPYVRRQPREPISLRQSFRQIPGLIRRDDRFRKYLIHIILMAGIFIMVPFMSIHVLGRLHRTEGFLGYLLAAQMAGNIFGNVLTGFLGDRYGAKLPTLLGTIGMVGLCIWTPAAGASWEFLVIYFALGLAWSSSDVGRAVLGLELCPQARRASYLAIMSAMNAPAMLIASQVSSFIWGWTGGSFAWVSVLAGLCLAAAAGFLATVAEPRSPQATYSTPR